MPRPSVIIRLRAENDRSGNPRRLYVQLASGGPEDPDMDGVVLGAWDEGYQGHNCVTKDLRPKAKFAPTFDVTTRQYLDLKKEHTT